MKSAKIGDKVVMARNFLNSIQASADLYNLQQVLHVNDHGNITPYNAFKNGSLHEVHAIV